MPFRRWRHVFKLDPDRTLDDARINRICESGTDAIIVGGSSGVNYDNTQQLLFDLRRYDLPCALEVSNLDAAVPGFDLYFVPIVLNTQDTRWLIGEHHHGIKRFGEWIPWEKVYAEGYIILNEEAEAARVANANTDLSVGDVIAYTRLADHIYRLPIIYIEYSGSYGNLDWVEQAAQVTDQAHLFYGGGIDGPDKAMRAAAVADTVIVGNALYDQLDAALHTVAAVKSVKRTIQSRKAD